MKPHNSIPPPKGGGYPAGYKGHAPVRIPRIPMEWMDPMSWRLPSGKELAEFWLQTGFLAPLMLGGPAIKRKKGKAQEVVPAVVEKSVKEAPEHSGSFREA
jgi:hypothetical protein